MTLKDPMTLVLDLDLNILNLCLRARSGHVYRSLQGI